MRTEEEINKKIKELLWISEYNFNLTYRENLTVILPEAKAEALRWVLGQIEKI